MAFVNEYIPSEDYKKHNFDALNKRPKETSDTTPADFWTIDREADIWLREFYTENDHTAADGGFTGLAFWDFYWNGSLMLAKTLTLEVGGGVGKPCWGRKKLLAIDIPPHLKDKRKLILKALEAAFTAYKDGGVLSRSTSFTFNLEV